jgi:pimeloyl-ACP methyl ester carboxylesterase
MAEHVLAICPAAEASWYAAAAHVPHLEEPGRFNRELAALTRRASQRPGGGGGQPGAGR